MNSEQTATDPKAGIFGSRISADDSNLVIIPVPWEATASYGGGSSRTPSEITPASHQLDFFEPYFQSDYSEKVHLLEIPKHLENLNKETKDLVEKCREQAELEELAALQIPS